MRQIVTGFLVSFFLRLLNFQLNPKLCNKNKASNLRLKVIYRTFYIIGGITLNAAISRNTTKQFPEVSADCATELFLEAPRSLLNLIQ